MTEDGKEMNAAEKRALAAQPELEHKPRARANAVKRIIEEVIDAWAGTQNKDRQKSASKFAELLATAKQTQAPELVSIESQIEAYRKAMGESPYVEPVEEATDGKQE